MNLQEGSKANIRDVQKESLVQFASSIEVDRVSETTVLPHSSDILDLKDLKHTLNPYWKILILDKYTRKIISSSFNIRDLNDINITLLLQIENDQRTAIHADDEGTVALYFIEPSDENMNFIELDFMKNMYSRYCFHFSRSVDISFLEGLAQLVITYGLTNNIVKVTNGYYDYICLESNLFTLDKADSFSLLNDPTTSVAQMQAYHSETCSALMSVLVNLEICPLIRYIKGSPSEALAVMLNNQIKKDSRKIFENVPLEPYSLLLLIDRNYDLSAPLRHCWSYGSLIYDLFEVNINKIKVPNTDISNNGRPSYSVYHLDEKDRFWNRFRNLPFGEIAGILDEELKSYRAEVEAISTQLQGTDVSSVGKSADSCKDLMTSTRATSLMPTACVSEHVTNSIIKDLEKKKIFLDLHMNLALHLLRCIERRSLDKYYEFEVNSTWTNKSRKGVFDFLKEMNRIYKENLEKLENTELKNLPMWQQNHEADKFRVYMLSILLQNEQTNITKQQSLELEQLVNIPVSTRNEIFVFLQLFKGIQHKATDFNYSSQLSGFEGAADREKSGLAISSPSFDFHSTLSPKNSDTVSPVEGDAAADLLETSDSAAYNLSSFHMRLLKKLDVDSGSVYLSDMLGSLIAGVRRVVGDGNHFTDTPISKLSEQLSSMQFKEDSSAFDRVHQPPQSRSYNPLDTFRSGSASNFLAGSGLLSSEYILPSGYAQLNPRLTKEDQSVKAPVAPYSFATSPLMTNLLSPSLSDTTTSREQSTRQIVVYVSGGLSYHEYLSLHESLRRKYSESSITIGTSDVIHSSDFLNQLKKLGQKLSSACS